VLDAAGKDLILVETVGVGQAETAVSDLAHLTVLVCAPGMGDDVQMIKAGVLETADVFAVNKADLPDAQRVVRQLRASAHLGAGKAPPIVETIATTGEGAAALLDVLQRLRGECAPSGEAERVRRLRRTLGSMAAQELARRLSRCDAARFDALAQRVLTGNCGVRAAVDELLRWAPAAVDERERR
jgi:LAO/AO transport system kinase